MDRQSEKDLQAIVEQRVEARLEEEKEKARQAQLHADLFELQSKVKTLTAQLEMQRQALSTVATGYSETAASLAELEEGQLSSKSRNRVITYGAGAGTGLVGIVELIRVLVG